MNKLGVLLILLISLVCSHSVSDFASETLSNMNQSVDPCNDFYEYACGGWISTHQIPPDRGQIYRSFTTIEEYNNKVLKTIVEDKSNTRVNQYYSACMNIVQIDSQGIKPIGPLLDIAESLSTQYISRTMQLVGLLHTIGIDVFFSTYADIDAGNPTQNIAYFGQGGLGLPSASIYTSEDSQKLMKEYHQHVSKMLNLIGFNQSVSSDFAKRAIFVETSIAQFTLPPDELNDPFTTYNKIDLKGLEQLAPNLNWLSYLEGLGFPSIQDISVDALSFYSNLSDVLPTFTDLDIQAYTIWQVIHSTADILTTEIVAENFNFYGKILSGLDEPAPRERTCIQATDSGLGDTLGIEYAGIAFSGSSLSEAQKMIQSIEDSMEKDIKDIDWMDDTTKQRALKKLSLVFNMIGYPDPSNADNRTSLLISENYAHNVLNTRRLASMDMYSIIGGPSDRYKWGMTADTINAYYDPTRNEMVFPASILQTPYFNSSRPKAANYGGSGVIMGHELTHGFDNQGKDYDGTGKLKDWWEPETREKFDKRVKCVIDQYSKFEILPGLFVNGKLTQGENIADMGGTKNSLHSYLKYIGNKADQPSEVPGLSNIELYFVAYAQGWCAKRNPEVSRIKAATDPHSPPKFRVLGPLINLEEFSEVFNCPSGSFMNPKERCSVW
eukprot:TRINITY_DN5383_c0_g1_i1.p1 TRINITY_DN5383_c0_g1~~TRINITY_DN5383_c0_g1_i1.p1  ORF type:complete len:676 (-),score=163.85 TRINITY_DN5383_c0_g1_i1:61-2058(-)